MKNQVKIILILVVILISNNFSYAKHFLDSYRAFKVLEIKNDKQIDSLIYEDSTISSDAKSYSILKERKKQIRIIENQIKMLDTIFKSYKKKTGYDFKNADTIIMIYTRPLESSNSNYIVYSRTDTIYFRKYFKEVKKNKYEARINYETFFDVDELGRRFSSENDTIVKYSFLFNTEILQKIVDNSPIVFDGHSTIVVSAVKINTNYKIDIKRYRPFVIRQKL